MVDKHIMKHALQLTALMEGLSLSENQVPDQSPNSGFFNAQICDLKVSNMTFILTQSWNYKSSPYMVDQKSIVEKLGPLDSFTIHGLWKDDQDNLPRIRGTSPEWRLESVLQLPEFNAPNAQLKITGKRLLKQMRKYWKGTHSDERLWEHEYFAHGKDLEKMYTACHESFRESDIKLEIINFQNQAIYDYFRVTNDLFKGLETMKMLRKKKIYPSLAQTYTLGEIQTALTTGFNGMGVYVHCDEENALNQVRYKLNLKGTFAEGNFEPSTNCFVESSNCFPEQIRFLPKGALRRASLKGKKLHKKKVDMP